MKKINERCPLQSECDRTCKYVGHEKDCDYYLWNARPGFELADQPAAPKPPDEPIEIVVEERAPEARQLVYIPIGQLSPHPDNPRKDLGDLSELAESIKIGGILQNLTVVPWFSEITHEPCDDAYQQDQMGYRVVIGHRRLAAAKLAGLAELPCIISDMDQKQQVSTMLLENLQRSDLTVYEQAQGFQMMLDFGETVDSISEKTGFSKTTVRRRLKMTELDQSVLQSVADRQISILDFDKLAEIEDVSVRNACLQSIGTNNFNQAVNSSIRKQEVKKNLPTVKAEIKKLHANKIERSATYGGKYHRVAYINLANPDYDALIPLESESRKLYYCIEESYGEASLYVDAPKAKPVRRSASEIERQKRVDEAWASIREKTSVAYGLRCNFVADIAYSGKNSTKVLMGALAACVLHVVSYVQSTGSNDICRMLGVPEDWSQGRASIAVEKMKDVNPKDIPHIIYATFADRTELGYFGGYQKEFPRHSTNAVLDGLYNWLISLGYEMSDDEKSLRDGSNSLFHCEQEPAAAQEEVPDETGQV